MKLTKGLSRQIILSMSAVVLGVMLLVVLGSLVFYAFFWPSPGCPTDRWMPSGPEWIWISLTTCAGLGVGVAAAVKLSRRILAPLNSVAESLRKVARGDLEARAVADDHSLHEAASLVDDFNTMAERLQRMTREQEFWNAAIAHELRTPVTILRGRLQGLAEGIFAPDPSLFRSLLAHVEGLTHLIEDLRVVGLADSGHLELCWQDIDLATEIGAVTRLLESGLHSAGFELVLDLEDQRVCCDPVRIRQALLALLENVRCHATPGLVRIQTRVEDGICHLRVEDEGPGIDETMVARVFEAFKRGEHSGSAQKGGSGLGLAVVRAIAQAHGGRAVCRRAAKGGTLFELSWSA